MSRLLPRIPGLALLTFAGFASAADCAYEACVGLASGPRHHATIAAALEAGRGHDGERWRVFVAAGAYREKLVIDIPGVELMGAGRQQTVIHYDAYAGQARPGGGGNWGTWESATLIVRAPDFRARSLTISNRFDYLANDALPAGHPGKQRGSQAVALMTDHGSDRTLLEDVALESYQDTLFVLAGRTLVRNSLVSGSVDFIFGAGTAVFVDSEIRVRRRGAHHSPHGYITAPSTHVGQPYGLVFLDCRLTREHGVPDDSTSLGRPWHPTREFPDGRYADPDAIGAAVFINSWMDAHISGEGWAPMGGWARDGSRVSFAPADARFYEYLSHGPGARVGKGRRQLGASDADRYTLEHILGDWRPRVPQPLPREPAAYSPQRELEKHRGTWPGLKLASVELMPGVSVKRDVVYANTGTGQLRADVFFPTMDDGLRPGVVLVHGGGWRSGKRQFLEPMARRLAAEGYVATVIDYRLSREALYPAAVEDIGRAVEWLRSRSGDFALDPDQIALLGTSAGGHLAVLAGVMGRNQPGGGWGRAVQAVVNIDGVVDMSSNNARRFEDVPEKPSLFGLWIGGRFADYPELWRQASPLQQLGETVPPTLFVNSSQARFRVGREAFLHKLRHRGIAHESFTFADTPHTFWLFERWFAPTVQQVLAFFERVL